MEYWDDIRKRIPPFAFIWPPKSPVKRCELCGKVENDEALPEYKVKLAEYESKMAINRFYAEAHPPSMTLAHWDLKPRVGIRKNKE